MTQPRLYRKPFVVWIEVKYMAVSYPAVAMQKVVIPVPEEHAARAEEVSRALEARRKGWEK